MGETIRRIRDEYGVTILLVEHHMGMVMGISDRVVAMEFGRKIAEGTPARGARRSSGSSTHTWGHQHERRLLRSHAVSPPGYGQIEVLHGIDFTVGEGEIVVILGANGAGKTTTMRTHVGHDRVAAARSASTARAEPAKPDAVVRAGISQVPQGRGTFTDLTVEDNLIAGAYTLQGFARLRGLDRWFEAFPRLAERRAQTRRTLVGRRAADARRSPGR